MPGFHRCLHIAMVFAVAFILPTAADPADVQTFFDRSRARLVQVAEATGAERLRRCEQFMLNAFAVSAMARVVATPERWSIMRLETRGRLIQAVSDRLARECASLVDRTDPQVARIGRVRETGGGVRLTVLMPKDANDESVVVWSLVAGGSYGWTATDLSIDGRGAAATFRQDFENAALARPGTMDAAIAYFAGMRSG